MLSVSSAKSLSSLVSVTALLRIDIFLDSVSYSTFLNSSSFYSIHHDISLFWLCCFILHYILRFQITLHLTLPISLILLLLRIKMDLITENCPLQSLNMPGSHEESLTLLFYKGLSTMHLVPYLTMNGLIALSNIITNAFLLHALYKCKKSYNLSFLFVKFLSISDVTVGVSQMIYLVCRCFIAYYSTATITVMHSTIQTMFYITSPFSGGMILIIAADRYIHMKYLTKYNVIMTRNRAWILIFMNFVFQCTIAVSLLFASLNGYFTIEQPVLVCAYLLMFGAAVALYQEAFRSISRRTRNSSVSVEPITVNIVPTERRNPSYDFSKTMMYILISLVICYLPFLTLTTTRSIIILCHRAVPFSLMYALLWTYNLNFILSTLNPVIFITYNKELRSYAKKMIYRKVNKRISSQWDEFSMVNLDSYMTEPRVRRLIVASSPC